MLEARFVSYLSGVVEANDLVGRDTMKNNRISRYIARFLADESGPTATEYAVMLSLIIIVCFVAITTIGTKTSALFPDLAGVM